MPHDPDHQTDILNILENFHGIEPLRKLFWTELNYDHENTPLPYQDKKDDLASEPVLWATGGADNAFHVIYTHLNSDRLLLTAERRVITQLLKNHLYALFIFSNRDQTEWHIVNVRHDADDPDRRRLYRRITIRSDEKLRTASERIAMLDLASIDPDFEALSPLPIQARHDEAFNVEAVTEQFFDHYKAVFQSLQEDLTSQTEDQRWAHDYALQFLNRCMFLYFIQRKGWLGEGNRVSAAILGELSRDRGSR